MHASRIPCTACSLRRQPTDSMHAGLILKYWRQHKNIAVILTYLRTHVMLGEF